MLPGHKWDCPTSCQSLDSWWRRSRRTPATTAGRAATAGARTSLSRLDLIRFIVLMSKDAER